MLFRRNKMQIIQLNIENILFFVMVFFIFIFNYQEDNYGNLLTNGLIIIFILYELLKNIGQSHGILQVNHNTRYISFFVLICAVSVVYSSSFTDSLDKLKTMIILLVLLVALNYFFKGSNAVRVGLITIALCAGFAALYLLTQSNWRGGHRITGIIGDSNQVGAYMAYSLCVILLCMKKRILPKPVCFVGVVLIFIANILSGSRTSLLVTIIGAFIFIIMSVDKAKKYRALKTIIIIAVVLVGLYLLFRLIMTNNVLYSVIGSRYESYFDILTKGKSSINENSTFERAILRELAWKRFVNNLGTFFLGNGIASFNSYYASIGGRNIFAHNNYLELLSDVGIVGTLFYYIPYANIFIQSVKKYRLDKNVASAFSIAVIVQMLLMHWFVVFYYQKLEFVFLALLIGMCFQYKKLIIKESEDFFIKTEQKYNTWRR